MSRGIWRHVRHGQHIGRSLFPEVDIHAPALLCPRANQPAAHQIGKGRIFDGTDDLPALKAERSENLGKL
jgi:hypothetical protein